MNKTVEHKKRAEDGIGADTEKETLANFRFIC
jgi:hypothetical protein